MPDKRKRRGDLDELDFQDYEEEAVAGRPAPTKKKPKAGKEGRGKGAQLLEAESELEFIPESQAAETAPGAEAEPVQTADLPELAVEEARFFIDTSWYDQRGLDFNFVARVRFCPECVSKLGSFTDERVPVVHPKTKKVSFEVRQVPYGEKPLSVLRGCCSGKRDYVTPDTPLMEAVFRVFLANGNQPMTISTLREHLLTYMPEMAALRSEYPPKLLEKMIRADGSYGMREHELLAAV